MCAVIGAILLKPTKQDFALLRNVFIESKIRGMHATGASFLPNWSEKVITIKQPIPADQFSDVHLHNDNYEEFLNADGNLYLVGHCRYSTSDLEYNQPISNDTRAIVHNGVITQELPEKWKDIFHYTCETKNDSELVLHSDNALEEYPDASMAVCELSVEKKLTAYRNGKRPLYMTNLKNGILFTSTADIPKRAGIEGMTTEVPMNTYITFDDILAMTVLTIPSDKKDLQHVR